MRSPGEFVDLDHFMNEMRLMETKSELEIMKRQQKFLWMLTKGHEICKPEFMNINSRLKLSMSFKCLVLTGLHTLQLWVVEQMVAYCTILRTKIC